MEGLLPDLGHVSLHLGRVLYQSGDRIPDVYFPTTSVVSLVSIMEDGETAEVGMIGHEGMVGLPAFTGGDHSPYRAIVQVAGSALRMKSEALREGFNRGGALRQRLLRYTQALLTQISQSAVCNRHHPVEAQFSRWLLEMHDRAGSDELRLTEGLIATMLGADQAGVTGAVGTLRRAGLITHSRGQIRILDRPGLESFTCACYRVVKEEFDRLLGA